VFDAALDSTFVDFDTKAERIAAKSQAGEIFNGQLENIRDTLDTAQDTGTTLGKTLAATATLNEVEIEFGIRTALPTKAAKAVKEASDEVKRAGSG
jgi:hypothetical protein